MIFKPEIIAVFFFILWETSMLCLFNRHKQIEDLRKEIKFLRMGEKWNNK